MKPVSLLFLLGSVVNSRTGKPDGGGARQQEVDLLLFGIVQFGQAYKRVHDATGAEVTEIGRVLRRREEALRQLGAATEKSALEGERMKEELREIQVREKCKQGEFVLFLIELQI